MKLIYVYTSIYMYRDSIVMNYIYVYMDSIDLISNVYIYIYIHKHTHTWTALGKNYIYI